jgi:hypothetical protein
LIFSSKFMNFYLNDLRSKWHFHGFIVLLCTHMFLKFILSRTLFVWFNNCFLTTSCFKIIKLQYIINWTTTSNSQKRIQFFCVIKMPATTKLSMWTLKYRRTLLSKDMRWISNAFMGLKENIIETVIFWGKTLWMLFAFVWLYYIIYLLFNEWISTLCIFSFTF